MATNNNFMSGWTLDIIISSYNIILIVYVKKCVSQERLWEVKLFMQLYQENKGKFKFFEKQYHYFLSKKTI